MPGHEFQDADKVVVIGAEGLTHSNGGGIQVKRLGRPATLLRRDNQFGFGAWRVQYPDGRQDIVLESRLVAREDDE